MKNKQINLQTARILGKGMERICYLHPTDSRLVIKIPQKEKEGSAHQNCLELKSYARISRKHGDIDCIAKCYGFIDTNLGEGLVCDCVRDYSGEISASLYEILVWEKDYTYNEIVRCVRVFCDFLFERNIQLFDLNAQNIVIKRTQKDEYRAVSIDLKGRYANNEFIPLSTYFPYFSRKKIQRRTKQLFARMEYFRQNGHLFRDPDQHNLTEMP